MHLKRFSYLLASPSLRSPGYLAAPLWVGVLVLCMVGTARAQDAVTPGELIIEPPTLICLGFEWQFEGDENADSKVSVQYRQSGTAEWKAALPLFRGSYKTSEGSDFYDPTTYRQVTMMAGSILDLEPGTAYDVRLEMSDPDGVEGEAVKELQLETRAEPVIPAGGEVRHVYPPEYKGDKEEPAYHSLMHAVNGYHTWCDEMQTLHPDAAAPGTVIKMHAGEYKVDRGNYRYPFQLWLHGTYVFNNSGTPDKPIAIVHAGDGEVIIDGADCHMLFDLVGCDYLHFEGLTFRNAHTIFYCGYQGREGTSGLTVKNCRLENIAFGVMAQDGRSENFYIADNVFIGSNPADKFNPESGGAYGRTKAGYAVTLSGKGHVVCYNRAENFWDGLNVFTGALADPASGQTARAIDFYNNEVLNSTDNFIEADGGLTNIRILRNRCFNVMGLPFSVQPVYAGPVYYIRNISFNQVRGGGFKLAGGNNALLFNNTLDGFTTMDFVSGEHLMNNVFAGIAYDEEGKKSVAFNTAGEEGTHRDFNAYRISKPLPGLYRVGKGDSAQAFSSIQALAEATGYEEHGLVFADYSVFQDAAEPPHGGSNKDPLIDPADVDLRPAQNSPLIDAGVMIPNVTDDFTGKAPDIGAYETGRPAPIYGPRTVDH